MRLFGTLYAAVYFLMILVIFILPYYSAEGYSTVHHSLSELGAQATPGNWIMNLVFILLSVVAVLLATKVLRRFWFPLYLLYFFAISLFFTGVFQHAPINSGFFLEGEHIAHSIFSTITGTAFSVYCVVIVFYVRHTFEKASAIIMCCLAVGLSLLMFAVPEYRGIFQRILFMAAFGWLFYSLVTFKFVKALKKA